MTIEVSLRAAIVEVCASEILTADSEEGSGPHAAEGAQNQGVQVQR